MADLKKNVTKLNKSSHKNFFWKNMSLKTGKPECINCEDLWYFSSCHQLMEKVSLIFITVSLKVEIFPGTIFCKFQSILVKLVLEI